MEPETLTRVEFFGGCWDGKVMSLPEPLAPFYAVDGGIYQLRIAKMDHPALGTTLCLCAYATADYLQSMARAKG